MARLSISRKTIKMQKEAYKVLTYQIGFYMPCENEFKSREDAIAFCKRNNHPDDTVLLLVSYDYDDGSFLCERRFVYKNGGINGGMIGF